MYPAQSGAYPSHPVPAQPMHPSPPSYPQATSQQESNTVVVVQRQPTVTTTVITPVGDYYYTASIVLTFICLFCGSWWSLCCTIPAIFMASSAKMLLARVPAVQVTMDNSSGLNICECVLYTIGHGSNSSGEVLLRYIQSSKEQQKIALSSHINPTSGHMGKSRTLFRIKERFMWHGMVKDVNILISIGDVCQRMNRKLTTGVPQLHPISVKAPWYMIGIDFIGPHSADVTRSDTPWGTKQPQLHVEAFKSLQFDVYDIDGSFLDWVMLDRSGVQKAQKSFHTIFVLSWNQEQETAFQLIKKRMTSAPVLAFYDVKKPSYMKRPDGRKYRRNCKHLRVKYQVRTNHYNATKTQGGTSKGGKGDGVAQNKDLQQATPPEEGTDVGGDVQPEHEVTQNEDQQQESLTEEEDDVAGERQSVPKDQTEEEDEVAGERQSVPKDQTEKEDEVAGERQSVPIDQQAQEPKSVVNKEPGRPKRAVKPPQRYTDYVKP
eukprot:Em0003g1819a